MKLVAISAAWRRTTIRHGYGDEVAFTRRAHGGKGAPTRDTEAIPRLGGFRWLGQLIQMGRTVMSSHRVEPE